MDAILRATPGPVPGDDVDAARSDVCHGVGPRRDGSGRSGIGVVLGDQPERNNSFMKIESEDNNGINALTASHYTMDKMSN